MSERTKGTSTVEVVRNIVEPIAEELGLELWDVRFVKEGTQWYLRVFIDKDEGIGIDDCERLSRAIDGPLDEKDPISQSYCLEVCSPGIERELLTQKHFDKYAGEEVKVRLIRPDEKGEREFTAILLGMKNNEIELKKEEGKIAVINKKDIAFVKLNDWEEN